jgi:hypothetical protein
MIADSISSAVSKGVRLVLGLDADTGQVSSVC